VKCNIVSIKKASSSRSPNPSCIIFILAVLSAGDVCFGFDDEGFQYWSTAQTYFDLDKNCKLAYEEEFKLGDDGGNLYYHHSDLGVVYKGLSRSIDLGVNYRQIQEKDSQDKWRPEYRPHFNVTLKNKLFGLDVSDRSRIEYRARENSKDIWRYRNKLSIEVPLEIADLKLRPYLADEVFFDLNDKGYSTNRLYSGLAVELSKNTIGDIYFLWQTKRSGGEWQNISVLGTKLVFRF